MTNLNNNLLATTTTYHITDFQGQNTDNVASVGKFENIISAFLGILTIVAVIYFVIQIILAGFTLISSKGDPKMFQVAQSKLIHNLMGLLIVVVAFGIAAFLTNLLGLGNVFNLKESLPTF